MSRVTSTLYLLRPHHEIVTHKTTGLHMAATDDSLRTTYDTTFAAFNSPQFCSRKLSNPFLLFARFRHKHVNKQGSNAGASLQHPDTGKEREEGGGRLEVGGRELGARGTRAGRAA